MLSGMMTGNKKLHEDLSQPAACALWPVDLKLTHVSCSPEDTLVHFQGQYLTICELDYNILNVEIQNTPKTMATVEIGEDCLVEDVQSNRWYRGRVQNQQKDFFDVFLIDHGNVLSVKASHLATALEELFMLPPKIVCGFFSNVLPLGQYWDSLAEKYFASLIGSEIKGFIHTLLPYKVLILESPAINKDLFRLSLGRHVDTDTFLLLVEILIEVPLKKNFQTVPDLLIEKQGGQEFSFKSSSFKGFEDILIFSGPKMITGQRVQVRVTAAVNTGKFYCQMTSMVKDLQDMSNKLALSCDSKTKASSQKPSDNLGILCSVKGKDEKWRRGYVQFLPVNSQVRVLFVDYGFCESVKVEDVLQLPTDFLSTTIMAFPCALSCLNGQDESVQIQQRNCFKKGLLGGVLDVEIDGFDKEHNLYLVTMYSAEEDSAEPTQNVPNERKCDFVLESETDFPLNGYLNYERAIVKTMDNSVIVEEIEEGSILEGYVEHVLNPGTFWLRTKKRNQDFEVMMKDMSMHFSKVQLHEEILEKPEPGALCCAMYELDMQYYRAIVTDKLDKGVEVFFIDFGNTEKVPHMLIKQMPQKFAIEPAFALSCSLVNVLPFDDVWTISATDYFRRAVYNKALLVHVVNIKKDRYMVDLYEKDNYTSQTGSKSITELLTTTRHAEFWKYTPSAPVIPKGEKTMIKQMSFEKGEVHGNGSCRTNINKNLSKEKLDISELDGYKTIHEIPKSVTSINKTPGVRFQEQKFKPGSELAVRCCQVNTPSDFWCQVQSKIPKLEEIMEAIQQYYQKHTVPVQFGVSCCVVKSKEDGRWYRGCIIGANNDVVDVIFVDFGTVIKEKIYNLQAIVPEFLDLEGQAFRCSLYNLIEPAKGSSCEWETEACNLLKEFTQGQSVNLTCSVHAQITMKNVGLLNVVNLHNTYLDVAKKLVEKGLAREVQPPTQLIPSARPDTFVHSSFNLRCGSEAQVYVSHVCSPWEIYCQLERNTAIIEDLMKNSAMESEERLCANPGLSKLCLAKYDGDGKWYRGVASPIKETLLLNVFFVDYGNMHIVEKHNVVTIPKHSADLLFTPMQAIRCSLSQIKKGDNYAEVNKWLEKSILYKPLRAIFVGKKEDGTRFINLYDGDLDINKKVKELIACQKPEETNSSCGPVNCHGEHNEEITKITGQTTVRKILKPTGNGQSFHNKHQHTKKQSTTAKKAKSAKCSVAQQDWEEQSNKVDKNSEGKSDRCDLQTVSLQLPKLSQLPLDPKIKSGFQGLAFVSHINTVKSFFIQMQYDEESILKIGEDLNSDLLKDGMKNTMVSLRNNDLVAAEYEDDGAIYRAIVKENVSNDCFKVEFIDYGNVATVAKDKTYTLTSDFLVQHRLSIHCSLLNSDSYECDASFIDMVMAKPLMVEFISCFGAQWEVSIEIQQYIPTLAVRSDICNDGTEHDLQAVFKGCLNTVEKQPKGKEPKEENKNHTNSQGFVFTVPEKQVLPEVTPNLLPTKQELDIGEDQRNRNADSSTTAVPLMNSNQFQSVTMRSVEHVKDKSIPSQDIRAGQSESGTLLSILNNGKLYLRLHRSTEQFAILKNLIIDNQFKCKVMLEANVKEGVQCLAKSTKDEQWHRAVIQHFSIEQGKCIVFFVDHGTTDYVSLTCMKEISVDLKQTPVQAVLCKWNAPGLPISEGYAKFKDTLTPMVGKDFNLMFKTYCEPDNLWTVEIMMNGLFLNQQMNMLASECAEEIPSPKNPPDVILSEEEPCLENSPQRLFLAPVTMDLRYSGFAAAVTTPGDFSIVLEDLLLIMNTVSTILKDLPEPEELSPFCEKHFLPRSCCLLRSDSKNKWCRAEIVHFDEALVMINLVDYGHCVDLPYQARFQLRRLPEPLTGLPKIAYPCVLRGVQPVEGQWTDEAVVYFQECICQKNLQIYFRQHIYESHWEADIVADGVYVAKNLVDAGHAEYTDIMLGLRFQEQIAIKIPQQKQCIGCAEKTPKPEKELKPPRVNTHLEQLNDLNVDGTTSSQVSFCGQQSEKASKEAEKMIDTTTVIGKRQCLLM